MQIMNNSAGRVQLMMINDPESWFVLCQQIHCEWAIATHFEDAAIPLKLGRKQELSYSRNRMKG